MGKSDPSRVHQLARRALSTGGAQLGVTLTVQNAAPRCATPVRLALFHTQTTNTKGKPLHGREVAYLVPCRQCKDCKRAKAAVWYNRVKTECDQHSSNYLVTLTVNPDERYLLDARAFGSNARPSELPELFKKRALALIPDIQKYVKRIRASTSAKIRYSYVLEPHKDYYPHVHILWHVPANAALELNARGYPAIFETKWQLGFVSARGAVRDNGKSASYVAKYLTKEATGIIRASTRYGVQVLLTDQANKSQVAKIGGVSGGGVPPCDAMYRGREGMMLTERWAYTVEPRTRVGAPTRLGDAWGLSIYDEPTPERTVPVYTRNTWISSSTSNNQNSICVIGFI